MCRVSLLILRLLHLSMSFFIHLQARLTVLEDFLFTFLWMFGKWKDVSVVLLADSVEGLKMSVFRHFALGC